jgi:hypothetical protein
MGCSGSRMLPIADTMVGAGEVVAASYTSYRHITDDPTKGKDDDRYAVATGLILFAAVTQFASAQSGYRNAEVCRSHAGEDARLKPLPSDRSVSVARSE